MASAYRLIVLVWLAACVAACSDDDRQPIVIIPGSGGVGMGGMGAIGGSAGSAGLGGVSGSAGMAGVGGATATGGASGMAGIGGIAGGEPCSTDGMLSYAANVQPILQRCVDCHDDGGDSGLDARSLAGLLAGGAHGPAIAPGDCANSILYQKVSAAPPFGARMPLGGNPLSDAELQTICTWIDQGAVESVAPCPMGGAGGVGGVGGSAGSAGVGTSDVTPPTFDGPDDVEEQAAGCSVSWEPAQDDVSAPSAIVYEVFVLAEGGQLDLTMPALVTAPGATSAQLALAAGQDYDIVVLARDEAGNRDNNARTRECSLR